MSFTSGFFGPFFGTPSVATGNSEATPNAFTLTFTGGPFQPAQSVTSQPITVSGLDTGVTVTASVSPGQVTLNGGTPTTSVTVANGDVVRAVVSAGLVAGGSIAPVLTIGGGLAAGVIITTATPNFIAFGDSMTEGGQIPSVTLDGAERVVSAGIYAYNDPPGTTITARWPTRLAGLLTPARSTTSTNQGFGGQKQPFIAAQQATVSAELLGRTHLIQCSHNSIGNDTDVADLKTAITEMVGRLGHDRYIISTQTSGLLAPGDATAVRIEDVEAWAVATYPDHTFIMKDWMLARPAGGLPGSGNDPAEIALGRIPGTQRTDGQHYNAYGASVYSDALKELIEAIEGGAPRIYPPYANEGTRVSFNDNVATGTVIARMRRFGTPTSWAITAGNSAGLFAINANGEITRSATAGTPTGNYDLTIQATNAAGSHTATLGALANATASFAPLAIVKPADSYLYRNTFAGGTNTRRKLSVVARLRHTGTDGTIVALLGIGTTGSTNNLAMERTATNQYRIFLRDSAGATLHSHNITNQPQATNATPWHWVFISLDCDAGVRSLALMDYTSTGSVWGAAGEYTGTFTPGTANPWHNGFGFAAYNTGNTSTNSRAIENSILWAADGYIDFTNSANRDLFRNTDGTPKDIGSGGTVSGITPFLFLRANAASRNAGTNHGAGGAMTKAGANAITDL